MIKRGIMASMGLTALVAVAFAVAPAQSAPGKAAASGRIGGASTSSFGFFTPAAADPRLAAIFARNAAVDNDRFRFTPVNNGKRRAVTVAVRASSTRAAQLTNDRTQPAAGEASIGLTPVAYSLGAAVGWKRFALAGDVSRINTGALPGGREAADLGISYNTRKWSSHVKVLAERPIGSTPLTIAGSESYSLDVGSSYRLTRNLNVTAGVRYRTERDRLQTADDPRRDSQAVYVGTSVRF